METSKLLLSGMRALWGVITSNVRKVSIDLDNDTITIYFYYNEQPAETEIELSEKTATEVIADFPEPFGINCERFVISLPAKINVKGFLIFSRFEKY